MRLIERQLTRAIRDCLADSQFSGQYWRGGNTTVCQLHDPGPNGARYIRVCLYSTQIALIEPGANRLSLYTGGFRTNTTKSRLNAILSDLTDGFGLYQQRFAWYLTRRSWTTGEPFEDGRTLGLWLAGR